MLTIKDILVNAGIDISSIRLVRHRVRATHQPMIDHKETWDEYQANQKNNKFGDAKIIVSFLAGDSTSAVFEGVYKVRGVKETTKKHPTKSETMHLSQYNLKRMKELSDLEGRIIIDWGKSTRSWVQRILDKKILEYSVMSDKHLMVKPFTTYSDTVLNWIDLDTINKNPYANKIWVDKLKSVNGLYLILEPKSGNQYIGSAYGKDGLWGRWSNYAITGHGNNKHLKKLCYEEFQFSILQITDITLSKSEVINLESLWKTKLGSRAHGLNDN